MGTPSLTPAHVRTRPVSVALELSGVKLWTCPPSGEPTRPSGCSALEPGRRLSGTLSPSPNASPTSSSMLPRAPPTAMLSRRRTNWSVLPSPTDKYGSLGSDGGFRDAFNPEPSLKKRETICSFMQSCELLGNAFLLH